MPTARRPQHVSSAPARPARVAGGRAAGGAPGTGAQGSRAATASRPAEASRPAKSARARRPEPPVRRPRSLTRIAILACIGVMLALTLLPTLRSYLRQEGQIRDLHALVAQQRSDVSSLQREQEQWNDPAYVEQQARERLKLVRPGERSYTVIDGGPAASRGAAAVAAAPSGAGPGSTWYARLWQSMVLADSAPDAGPSGPRAVTPKR